MRLPRGVPLLAAALTAVALTGPSPTPAAADPGSPCARQERVRVPGAALQRSACLADLTTTGLAGTPFTDIADQDGLTAEGTRTPSGVPGIQVDGYFRTPRTSTPRTAGGTTRSSSSGCRTTGTAASS
ncbi:hypothetical protein GCM10010424_39990 [Streptomyces lienomycini]